MEARILYESVGEIGASAHVARYLDFFGAWLFRDFRSALVSAEYGAADAPELTSALRPWIEELAGLGAQGLLDSISSSQAAELYCFLNHALDELENLHKRNGFAPANLVTELSPIEDILCFLNFRKNRQENVLSPVLSRRSQCSI